MTNDLTISDDGWAATADEASERIIRGTLLKFSDWKWSSGKENNPVAEGKRLVALGVAAAWVKWGDGKPVEYRVRQAGRQMPERDELGDNNKDEWEVAPDGEPRDPWQNARFVYLVDPVTAEAFTFSTSSWGGRGAVVDLGDQIQRMRFANPGAVPIVELHAAPMLTKFGRKSKPVLKVVDWRKGGESTEAPQQVIEHKKTETERVFDDSIPW